MHCDACAARLDALLSKLDGVVRTQSDYASKRTRVYAADENVLPLVLDAARRIGYSATLEKNSDPGTPGG